MFHIKLLERARVLKYGVHVIFLNDTNYQIFTIKTHAYNGYRRHYIHCLIIIIIIIIIKLLLLLSLLSSLLL
jgi:hypothetical protein